MISPRNLSRLVILPEFLLRRESTSGFSNVNMDLESHLTLNSLFIYGMSEILQPIFFLTRLFNGCYTYVNIFKIFVCL